jgi:transcription antitermination factor NusG
VSPIVHTLALDCIPRVQAVDAHDSSRAWYAVRIRSRFEKLASVALRAKGFEEYLPLSSSRHQWSDRIKKAENPLFPGYLFCRFSPQDGLLPIVTTRGFISVVGIGNTPIPIPDDEINSIKLAIDSGFPAQTLPYVSVGSRVLIERGPLAGVEGIALKVDNKLKLIVSITLLQRSLAVEIDREWARAIDNGVNRSVSPQKLCHRK